MDYERLQAKGTTGHKGGIGIRHNFVRSRDGKGDHREDRRHAVGPWVQVREEGLPKRVEKGGEKISYSRKITQGTDMYPCEQGSNCRFNGNGFFSDYGKQSGHTHRQTEALRSRSNNRRDECFGR